jgi:hypothetical protein
MVHFHNTDPTDTAMVSSRRFDIVAFGTPLELVSVLNSVKPASHVWIWLHSQQRLVWVIFVKHVVLRILSCSLVVLSMEIVIVFFVIGKQFGGEEVVNVARVSEITGNE